MSTRPLSRSTPLALPLCMVTSPARGNCTFTRHTSSLSDLKSMPASFDTYSTIRMLSRAPIIHRGMTGRMMAEGCSAS
jgi:hypothetical protein